MEQFVTILAYIFGSLSSLLLAGRILGWMAYDERDKLRDRLKGFQIRFPIKWPFVISVVCWTWIFTV